MMHTLYIWWHTWTRCYIYVCIWLYICIDFDAIKYHPPNQLKDWSVPQPTSALHFYSAFYWSGQSSTSMAHLVRTRMFLLGVTVWKNIFIYHICIMVIYVYIYIYEYACVCVNAWKCATQATQAAFDKNHSNLLEAFSNRPLSQAAMIKKWQYPHTWPQPWRTLWGTTW